MAKKICPNGHIYDSSIYGNQCPLCPGGDETQYVSQSNGGESPIGLAERNAAGGTRVTPPSDNAQPSNDAFASTSAVYGGASADGETIIRPQQNPPAHSHGPIGGGTVIRSPKGEVAANGRKLVGFLVTYNRNPLGKAYNIYEGKNYIGRDRSCDISVPEDNQMSGKHMSILYRNVDNKFKFRDEQSSNGTFVNKELTDEGELQNYDIIRLGSTVFIFIAIPKLG